MSEPSHATVYVADDNPVLLQGLCRALSANGYVVATAEDGSAMLKLLSASETPPDLVLLDVMMPNMTGLEVLRTMRGQPRWASLPVMLITAANDESLPAAAAESGAVDVLAKPFRLADLLARVATHIQTARQERALVP